MFGPSNIITKFNAPARAKGAPYAALVATLAMTLVAGLPTSARAGGLPEPTAPVPNMDYSRQTSDQNWTGFYLGASVGYGFGDLSVTGGSGSFDFDDDGTFASLHLGYDWQFGNFVAGLEGEWGAGDVSGNSAATAAATIISTDLNWLAAVRARAGVLIGPALLVYATGGYAWADIDLSARGATAFNISENFSGYQLGGGAEFRFAPSWALRFDYVFTDLEDENITAGGVSNNFDPDFHLIRTGLTLRY